MPQVKEAAAGKRAPAKRKLAEEFSPGEVLTDLAKKQWKVGAPIGQGGFGRLYLADENSSKSVGCDAPYVIKVEPSDNGPLFTELKFYMRAAKPDQIQKWICSQNLKYLGVPRYWGSGIYVKNGSSYRFMVMDRFGKDLHKIYEENGKRFTYKTVLQLSLRLLDILEYVHEHEYVHGDIKASNLLLSYKDPDQVYLVDYGLAYRYCPDGVHREYKEDPKRCHDGTLEYTSIDAHKGVAPSRRGDLEILGYCMIQWLSGRLPWEDNLKDANYVRDAKIRFSDEVSSLLDRCFPEKKPEEITKYMLAVYELGYSTRPPYSRLRDILLQGLKAIGSKDDGKMDFAQLEMNGGLPNKRERKKKQTVMPEVSTELESTESNMVPKKKGPGLSPGRKRAGSLNTAQMTQNPVKKRAGVPNPAKKALSPAAKRVGASATRVPGRNLISANTGKPSGRGRGRGRAT
ncbi:serine/threonine-protein kinase VRK1 [Rhinatrema bivittatum]|uniref:serine/threonine-protein kinase VRK1 n=1 Tax=Rhinatrema bivittatum TaxID=194408 RepID=UPI00112BB1EE|nr:serine/threonine-protein kinase VRK1 [Rhinatrema bivittatum]XP_029453768.1 serine/threonine-protein kinase VRK1 [Rhinatrema bivittatum]XP_029453769.1 serine/threonine-protein kinase VRK1 [Rhinatrema bivittatum]